MIFIENNKNNSLVFQNSQTLYGCFDAIFEFINIVNNKTQYIYLTNMSSNISSFDLYELEENSTVVKKKYSVNEPINLDNGQYLCYIHSADLNYMSPGYINPGYVMGSINTEAELEEAIKTSVKIYATKMVVENDKSVASNINKKYL